MYISAFIKCLEKLITISGGLYYVLGVQQWFGIL